MRPKHSVIETERGWEILTHGKSLSGVYDSYNEAMEAVAMYASGEMPSPDGLHDELFHEAYKNGRTWADLDAAVRLLNPQEIKALRDAFAVVDRYTGLDMRQEFLWGLLRHTYLD